MSDINVRDMLEEIDLEPALEAVEEQDRSPKYVEDDVKITKSYEEDDIGGTETMNTNTYNTEAKFNTNDESVNNTPSTFSSFVEVDRIDADSAYRRITFLKNELNNIKKYINSTNCANMDPVLQEIYANMEKSFKNAITFESIAVENGSSASVSPIGY